MRMSWAAALIGSLLAGAAATAASLKLEEPPVFGSYYQRYEPTFYTGFSPRASEASRVHLHVGRGNQARITVVLAEATQEAYAHDLQARRDTYRQLIGEGRVVLAQNRAFEEFEAKLDEFELDELVAEEAGMDPEALRRRNVDLLARLNPGRVFRIEIPEEELVRNWIGNLKLEDKQGMDRDRRLAMLNALLPTRLWIAETDEAMRVQLAHLVASAPQAGDGTEEIPASFTRDYFSLLELVSGGRYPRKDGKLRFVEFTAIYPIGTFNEYTDYKGKKIPLYPTPGRRALTTHQRTKTVDHIPTVEVYSYSPWLPYMHVGTKLHNSFHTLWWRMPVKSTAFLPESWKEAAGDGINGKPNTFLWLLSRGPMSSGCTHMMTGHINELRQIFPSDTQALYEIDAFLNRSYDYDVFDIDGDMKPEVMGVAYFVAYSLRNKKANQLRVIDERDAYYEWLYAGDLERDADGVMWLNDVQDGRFVQRTAKKGNIWGRLPLYEAAYERERFQFYKLVDIPFARELRKVGVAHPFQGKSRKN
jgi:hypothetical protein